MVKKQGFFVGIFVLFWVFLFFLLEGFFRLVGVGYSTEPFERIPGTPYYRDNPDFLNKYYPGRKVSRLDAKYKNLFLVHKPTNGIRIFIVGGSTAQGWPFEPNQSFGKMIEKALQEAFSDRVVEVVNVSYSALSSYYVADVVKKLFRYEPDVIVIYAGQNEYYGTISVTTGGNHWTKKAYLALREWRIFQTLFTLFERKETDNQTLMAQRFAGMHLPYDRERDERVALAFGENLKSVFEMASNHHVPVMVYEMAANLIHMPPFASEEQEELRSTILSNQRLFKRGGWGSQEMEAFLQPWLERYPSNAHLFYMKGLLQRERKEDFLPSLVMAKDMDTVPFRYREILRKTLWDTARRFSHVTLVPLHEEIKKTLGDEGFGRKLFIDHLHFNYDGQKFLARLGIAYLPIPLPKEKREKAMAVISDESSRPTVRGVEALVRPYRLEALLYLTAYDEIMTFQTVLSLMSQSPYKEMLLQFPFDPEMDVRLFAHHPLFEGHFDQLMSRSVKDAANLLFSYLSKEGRWDMEEMLLHAYRHNNPGFFGAYRNLAEFYRSRGDKKNALLYYGMTYLLAWGETRERRWILKEVEKLGAEKEEWKNTLLLLEKNPWSVYTTLSEGK